MSNSWPAAQPPERVLVTGAAGFIGSHLVQRLLEVGAEVHALVRPSSQCWRLREVADRIRVWRGDLADPGSLHRCVAGAEPQAVFHLAADASGRRWSAQWHELDSSLEVNLTGTLNLVRALHRASVPPRRLVRASSLAEYGEAPLPFEEGAREMPTSAYGASQAAATTMLGALCRQLPFSVVTLRLASVYGPGRSPDFFLPSLMVHCLENREFEMTSGHQRWDLIHIDDAVDAFLKAMGAELPSGEIINVGAGPGPTLRELAERVAERMGTPECLRLGQRAQYAGEMGNFYCRNSKARALMDWEPRVSLDDGLDRTIAWYRDHLDEVREQAEGRPDVNS